MPPEIVIRADDLGKTYGRGDNAVEVFSKISLTVERGEILFIMGPSGVGKSTLLHLMGGLDTPTEGKVYVEESCLSTMGEDERILFRRRTLGMVFQFHHLLDEFSVLENVAIPLFIQSVKKKEALERAHDMLVRLGLEDKDHRFPGELSGGEQQRVALARAMVTGACILLADEPTGNLDRDTEMKTMELLADLHGQNGWTSVIVTHNDHLMPFAGRVLRFEDGALRRTCV